MLWFSLSLLTAFFTATEAAMLKLWFGDLRPLEMGTILLIYSLPFFLIALPFVGVSELDASFWTTLAVLLPINILGFFLHMTAINISPLSLTMPYMAFTPAFVILTGFIFLGEIPSTAGAAGILVITGGSLLLNIEQGKPTSLSSMYRNLRREKGSACMLLASLAYAFAAVFGKKLILLSSPVQSGVIFFTIFNITVIGGLSMFGQLRFRHLLARPGKGAVAGTMLVMHIFCHFFAVSMVAAAYMIAVKRLSGLISVVYGGLIFKEKNIRNRFSGAAIMAAGAAMIALWG